MLHLYCDIRENVKKSRDVSRASLLGAHTAYRVLYRERWPKLVDELLRSD